jgi:hypothetical protein
MKGVPVLRDAETVGAPSSKARSLEEMKEKLAEQLKRAQQSNPMNAAEEKRQESVKLQLDSIEQQALSLRQQQPGNTAPSGAPSPNGEFAKDGYIAGDFSPSKPTGVYSLGKDEDGNPKILLESPEASNHSPLVDESGAKPSDEAEKKTRSAKPSDEEDERDVPPEEEDEDEKSEKASDEKKTTRTGTVNTGKVDAEIQKLRQEKQRIALALSKAAGDDQKDLQKRLEAIDSELRVKDTDSYRKQHSEYSESNG